MIQLSDVKAGRGYNGADGKEGKGGKPGKDGLNGVDCVEYNQWCKSMEYTEGELRLDEISSWYRPTHYEVKVIRSKWDY